MFLNGRDSILPTTWDDYLGHASMKRGYIDSREFKAYQRRIERLIKQCTDPLGMTTRAIHEALGYRARYEWTQDALDRLKTVVGHGICVTRYRPAGKQLKLAKVRFDAAFGTAAMMQPQFS